MGSEVILFAYFNVSEEVGCIYKMALILVNVLVFIGLMFEICIYGFFAWLIGGRYFCCINKNIVVTMKREESKMMRRFILFSVFLFSLISSGFCWTGSVRALELKGDWFEEKRNVTSYPITALIIDNSLLIEVPFSHADIKIQILEGEDVLYEELMPADLSVYSVLLRELVGSKSCYRVVLTNQWGGYLEGEFYF